MSAFKKDESEAAAIMADKEVTPSSSLRRLSNDPPDEERV